MVNAAFAGQTQGDIQCELQKIEGFAGMNASQILEVVMKVFINRDQEAQREADWKMEKKVVLLVATLVE